MKQFTEEQSDTAASDSVTRGIALSSDDPTTLPEPAEPPEVREAKQLALRYRLPFVNLLPPDGQSPIDYSLLGELPVDLMVRHQFVPLKRENNKLHIAMANPTDLDQLDELASALKARIVAHLATDSEMSPIIKLVDTIVYNAMESRASDIHIETRDTEVQVKYRIDGALYAKVDPIDLAFHQTLISRIKVMSELDIAERRVPQDGRFRVRYKGRNVDFRVSIMPTIHGEDAVIRILDKEQINESFRNLNLDVVGFAEED